MNFIIYRIYKAYEFQTPHSFDECVYVSFYKQRFQEIVFARKQTKSASHKDNTLVSHDSYLLMHKEKREYFIVMEINMTLQNSYPMNPRNIQQNKPEKFLWDCNLFCWLGLRDSHLQRGV